MEKIGSFKNGVMQWKYKPERAKRVYLISFAQAGIYIGSTIDIYKRFKNFVRGLTRNNYPNWKLQAAFNSSPTFEVYELEKLNPNDRRTIREQFFIDILRPELNICPAGLHYDNKRLARELSKLLRQSLNGNPTYSRLKEVADALGVEVGELFGHSDKDAITCPICGSKFKLIK